MALWFDNDLFTDVDVEEHCDKLDFNEIVPRKIVNFQLAFFSSL